MLNSSKKILALGNFDGVHKGHQAVIRSALSIAKEQSVSAAALTFEPHPRSLINPESEPFRLTTERDKRELLQALGLDEVATINFTEKTAEMPPRIFVEEIIVRELNAVHVVAGEDFAFGRDRSGNMDSLRQWLEPMEIGVTEAPLLMEDGKPISSSRIRRELKQGRPEAAAALLGRNWSVSGNIERGQKLGRDLGFPTANMPMGKYLRPKLGVYAIHAHERGRQKKHKGVANIGTRPTVNGKGELLEFHLFDFNEDIYGREWTVELINFIRPEETFPSFDALKEQIAKDLDGAKFLLSDAVI